MKNNKLLKIVYLLCILVLLSACGSSGNSNPLSSSQEKNIINAEQVFCYEVFGKTIFKDPKTSYSYMVMNGELLLI